MGTLQSELSELATKQVQKDKRFDWKSKFTTRWTNPYKAPKHISARKVYAESELRREKALNKSHVLSTYSRNEG